MNNFLPIYFYVSFFTYSKSKIFPFLLFSSFFIDGIVYPFHRIHTILTIIFFLLNSSWHIPNHLKFHLGRTFLNSILYVGCLAIIYQNFSIMIIGTNIFWNLFITFLYFKKRNFSLSKR